MRTTVCRERFDPRRTGFDPSSGAVVLGFCSVAMPAMTSVVLSDVAAHRPGLASGVLNTAR
jgi:hypothetical protein